LESAPHWSSRTEPQAIGQESHFDVIVSRSVHALASALDAIYVEREIMTNSVRVSAAIRAGVVAGSAFMILEMLLVPLVAGGSPWTTPRMIAAILLGERALGSASFDLGVFLVAMLLHFALSIAYATLLAAVVRNLLPAGALLVGIAFGLLLYLVNFYVLTWFFPWFAHARDLITVLSHAVFGALAGYVYRAAPAEPPMAVGPGVRAPMI
jgi:hypothetical protein